MSFITTTFFGAHGSGKTSLIYRLKSGRFVSDEERRYTRDYPEDNSPVYYTTVHIDESSRLKIWDISESDKVPPQYIPELKKAYLKDCQVCVYALDLSKNFDEEAFAVDIKLIKETSPDTAIVLVGCKSDLQETRKIDDALLHKIQKKYDIPYEPIITSALKDEKVQELFTTITQIGQYQKAKNYVNPHTQRKPSWLHRPTLTEMKALLKPNLPFYEAVTNLETLIQELPLQQRQVIEDALVELLIGLHNSEQDKKEVIETFVNKCSTALQEASALGVAKSIITKVSQGILVVAAASTVTVLLGSLIFGLGIGTLIIGSLIGAGIGYHLVSQGFFKSPINRAFDELIGAIDINSNFIEDTTLTSLGS
ncbi:MULTISPECIES: hypothetical protein [Legionella]|uniref:Rho GTPase (Miro-like) n=1 Tax=Legionella drozanskii LLAP-1 TaxID=1212489 RepID=A0A0W0SRW3_9GAMM|nr:MULTISPECIES: hypothetical protein [Legionella]KTC86091.1 Rho GTPase (Miro-like) [Legionella drozanskii LLAP-1]PJE08913.1 MAG: hypothetical protein CK430_11835 [Legionella sp.]